MSTKTFSLSMDELDILLSACSLASAILSKDKKFTLESIDMCEYHWLKGEPNIIVSLLTKLTDGYEELSIVSAIKKNDTTIGN